MAVDIGPRIGLDGESEYRKEIQNIIQQQKTLNSEMKAAASAFDKDSDSKKKNAKQVEILNKQIDVQKKRVEELTKMAERSAEKTGENSTETLKWKQAVNEATAELNRLEKELKSMTGPDALAKQLEESGNKLDEIGQKMTSVGSTLTKTVTAPIVGLGAAAVASFNEVDKGTDQIIKMTGATGEALKGLEKSFQNVATTVPSSMDSAAEAIGEINTRFGATGEQLEDLSGQFLKFAELNGTDVTSSVDSVQKVMSAYGISIDDTGKVLDTLNKVAQDSGINVQTLSQSLITNGSALRQLGMNAADSAVLLGELEKSGVDTSTVMTGLAKVQANAAKNNTSMADSLAKALSSSEGAIEIFGAKAGPRLYEAFESGVLSAEMFTGGLYSLDDAIGNVDTTFEATLDPMDRVQTTLNQLKFTGAEFGATMMDLIAPALQTVGGWVNRLSGWVSGLDDSEKKAIVTIGGLVAAIGPMISIGGKIVSGVGKAEMAIGKLIPVIAGLNPVTVAVVAGIAGVIAIGVTLYKNWDTIKEKATALGNSIRSVWDGIKNTTSNTWNSIASTISNTIERARTAVQNAINRMKSAFDFSWSLPQIKLPHIGISGGFSLNPLSTPNFSIQWYRKAYDQAVAFNKPTVLATSGGLKGFGDGNGAEIVIGANTLLNTMTDAVRAAFGYFPEGGTTSNTFGDTNITIIGAPGQDVEELADRISDIIDAKIKGQGEVYA